MKKAGPVQTITGVVDYYAWNGTNSYEAARSGGYGQYQPASNGGTIRLLTETDQIMLMFGGPGTNDHQAVTVDQFFKRAKRLLKSYCFGTKVTINYCSFPNESFPTILSVDKI